MRAFFGFLLVPLLALTARAQEPRAVTVTVEPQVQEVRVARGPLVPQPAVHYVAQVNDETAVEAPRPVRALSVPAPAVVTSAPVTPGPVVVRVVDPGNVAVVAVPDGVTPVVRRSTDTIRISYDLRERALVRQSDYLSVVPVR